MVCNYDYLSNNGIVFINYVINSNVDQIIEQDPFNHSYANGISSIVTSYVVDVLCVYIETLF